MSILIKPVVTEKMNADSELNNRYGFIVDMRANKIQIKKAVEDLYGVTVDKVRTINYLGKSRLRYTKRGLVTGKKNDYKKAIVQLIDGDTIDLYGNI